MVFLSDKSQCVHIWFSVRYVRIFNGIQDQNSLLWKCGLYILPIFTNRVIILVTELRFTLRVYFV